jgi:4-hydroxy-tetrahydrodipicolinate reductase
LIGATGRMGTAIVRESVRAGAAGKTLEVVAAVASPGSKSTGLDVGEVAGVKALGVRVVDELPPDLAKAQVAIDFSRAD